MSDPTLGRLENQLQWYETESSFNKRWYLRLRITSIVCAALVPLAAVLPTTYGPIVSGALGVAIVIVEGVRQLNGFHENWFRYRSTSEHLKHEKHLYLAGAGPYRGVDSPKTLLAERVEELVSTEHARWVTDRTRPATAESDATSGPST